jgi:N-acetylneuraminic acid mutarotase
MIQLGLARTLANTLSGLLALGLALATAAPALGQAAGTWTRTGSVDANQREFYTATLLQNGQVLIAGGFNINTDVVYATAFLFNPSTGEWTETGSLHTARYRHTATLLKNGEVLVTGGLYGADTAELYNPSTRTWSTTGNMTVLRFNHSAVLLQNGEVLVAGGETNTSTGATTNTAEIYNPSTGAFTATGSMHEGRILTQLTLLPNGQALVAGGDGVESGCAGELFSNGTWSLTANMAQCSPGQTFAALLANGDVLIEDGNTASEFYDPSTNVWQATLNQPNIVGRLALLADGNVLVAGTALVSGGSNVALYDPSTNEWTPTASSPLAGPFSGLTLTRLLNGQVLETERDEAALFTP